jgi:hypothetical protein
MVDKAIQEEEKVTESKWISEQRKKAIIHQKLSANLGMMMRNQGKLPFASLKGKISPAYSGRSSSLMMNEDDRIAQEIRERKKKLFEQNEIINKIRSPENIAMLSRFSEIHQNNRVETVRLPQIY